MIVEIMHALKTADLVKLNGTPVKFTTAALTGYDENQVLNLTYSDAGENYSVTFTEEGLLTAKFSAVKNGFTVNDDEGDEMELVISQDGVTYWPTLANPHMTYIVVQEGGSSTEIYVHAYSSRQAADYNRLSCASASYRTSEVIEVPVSLAHQPEFLNALGQILRASLSFSYPVDHASY